MITGQTLVVDGGVVHGMTAAWIAVDWGSSNLRAWAIDAAGAVVAEGAAADGASSLAPDGFEPALLAVIDRWLAPDARTDVIVCGMAGARGAWAEAAYAHGPLPADAGLLRAGPDRAIPRLSVRILPGLRQDRPADVMRGEETQIAGLVAAEPGFDGVACLPGTHTKWAHVAAGEVVSFASYMTGEVFALLSGASVLRKTLADRGLVRARLPRSGRGRPRAPRARAGAALPRCAPRRCCTASPPSAAAPGSRAC